MKQSDIYMTRAYNGFTLTVGDSNGDGYTSSHKTIQDAATALKSAIAGFPTADTVSAPPEVMYAMSELKQLPVNLTGQRLSYYASYNALQVIQARRDITGESLSAAVSALILTAP